MVLATSPPLFSSVTSDSAERDGAVLGRDMPANRARGDRASGRRLQVARRREARHRRARPAQQSARTCGLHEFFILWRASKRFAPQPEASRGTVALPQHVAQCRAIARVEPNQPPGGDIREQIRALRPPDVLHDRSWPSDERCRAEAPRSPQSRAWSAPGLAIASRTASGFPRRGGLPAARTAPACR